MFFLWSFPQTTWDVFLRKRTKWKNSDIRITLALSLRMKWQNVYGCYNCQLMLVVPDKNLWKMHKKSVGIRNMLRTSVMLPYHFLIVNVNLSWHCSNISATPVGQTGLEIGWFPLGNGVCLIMKKAPSNSPIWQLKKRELLLPLSFLITKLLKLDLSNFHYGPNYKPHFRTQGCVIRENNFTTPLRTPVRTPLRIL